MILWASVYTKPPTIFILTGVTDGIAMSLVWVSSYFFSLFSVSNILCSKSYSWVESQVVHRVCKGLGELVKVIFLCPYQQFYGLRFSGNYNNLVMATK